MSGREYKHTLRDGKPICGSGFFCHHRGKCIDINVERAERRREYNRLHGISELSICTGCKNLISGKCVICIHNE